MAEKKKNEVTEEMTAPAGVDTETGEVLDDVLNASTKAALLDGVAPVEEEETEEEYEYEGDAKLTGLFLRREKLKPRKKGDKPIFTYNIYGKLRGQDIRAGMAPPDKGGYGVLALLFGEADALPLYMVPYKMKDENTGMTSSGFTYLVMSTDEEGITLECKVKPSRDSDKRLLECLIQIAQRAMQ
ncbi:MAG: hypothetical protein E7585_01805 [Ruminococcaceae bacterium]|nr:hypothetical protein [Oscillospiraceae bacterium]